MPRIVKIRSFLRNFFRVRAMEADLNQEVRCHLEMLTEENIRAGMAPSEAQRAARIALGGGEQVKEQVREKRLGNWLPQHSSQAIFPRAAPSASIPWSPCATNELPQPLE